MPTPVTRENGVTVADITMLSVHPSHQANAQVEADSEAQAQEAGDGDMEQRKDPHVSEELRMPWLRKGPTGEGYCPKCHFIVGTYRKKLIIHAGYWAMWIGGAAYKTPTPKERISTNLVVWCEGSGKLPSPMPDNPLDPWEPHVILKKAAKS